MRVYVPCAVDEFERFDEFHTNPRLNEGDGYSYLKIKTKGGALSVYEVIGSASFAGEHAVLKKAYAPGQWLCVEGD